jgi:hypothetical protein
LLKSLWSGRLAARNGSCVTGSAKCSPRDRARFYEIALASLREVQAILDLKQVNGLQQQADTLGAHVYSLLRATRNTTL